MMFSRAPSKTDDASATALAHEISTTVKHSRKSHAALQALKSGIECLRFRNRSTDKLAGNIV